MRLTIIPTDQKVNKDGLAYYPLDLSECQIPNDVHALQWQNTQGWIEYEDTRPNDSITELPQWALNCEAVWQIAYDEDHPIDPPVDPIEEQML